MIRKYKESANTPTKQSRYRQAVGWECCVIDRILSRHSKGPWIDKIPCFVDTTCGPGISNDGEEGSPLILLKELNRPSYTFPAAVHFVDIDEHCISSLIDIVRRTPLRKNIKIRFHNMDNRQFLTEELDINKWTFGFIYNDPSGDIPTFDELAEFYEIVNNASCDTIINCPTTTINRVRKAKHCSENRCLFELMEIVNKTFWHITHPVGKHKWSMMIGMNSPKFTIGGLFHRQDSEEGQAILKGLNYTTKEKKALGEQLTFGFERMVG